jgi:hypothetical protein
MKHFARNVIEPLEQRQLLSGITAVIDGSVLRITGTPGDDTISIRQYRSALRVEAPGFLKTVSSRGIDLIDISGGRGNDRLQVNASIPCHLDGGDGNDALTGGSGDDTLVGGAGNNVLNGRGGTDTLIGDWRRDRVLDKDGDGLSDPAAATPIDFGLTTSVGSGATVSFTTRTGSRDWAVTSNDPLLFGNTTVRSGTLAVVRGNSGSLTVNGAGGNLIVLGGGTSNATVHGAATLNIAASPATLTINSLRQGNLSVTSGTIAIAAAAAHPIPSTGLELGSIDGNVNVTRGTLRITGSGSIDLNSNAAVIHDDAAGRGADLTAVAASIKSGAAFDAGSGTFKWNGPVITGINSPPSGLDPRLLTAIGAMINDNGAGSPIYTTFPPGATNGTATSINDILVRTTYFGDANLDGLVDGVDFALLNNGYANGLSGWSNGDFSYGSVIDGVDFALLNNAYGNLGGNGVTTPVPVPAPVADPVPTPAPTDTAADPIPATGATLEISAYIDGRDQLIIHRDTLQWHHLDYAAVGRWMGANEPTILTTTDNGTPISSDLQWVPDWSRPYPDEIRFEDYSSVLTGLSVPLPAMDQTISLTPIQARGSASIVQQPSAANDFTAIIQFDDDPAGGPATYDVRVNYAATN